MYIEQVIKTCDTLYPNPYTTEEKYFWCDELSELLTIKYNTQYDMAELSEQDGKYTLPEGVAASSVCKLILGKKPIQKEEFLKYGIKCFDTDGRCEILITEKKHYSRVYAIYIRPYEKIRNISFLGEATFGEDYFLTGEELFRAGDILNIRSQETDFGQALVLSVGADEESGAVKTVVSAAALPEGVCECSIKREVSEQTVCPAPYDNMYIDYLLGKICYYQNDFAACNNHMMLYNSKLADYEKWLKSHPIAGFEESKIRNWW